MHGTCSPLLSCLFASRAVTKQCTRGSSSNMLTLPAVRTRAGLFSFSFLAADRWNGLPTATRQLQPSHKFRKACLAHLGYPTES